MTAKILTEAKEVCPTTTCGLLTEGALLVDVREPNEVAALAFDVDAQVRLPLSQLEQRWAELPRDRALVLACETGVRSLKATYFLQYQGYERVANMGGGLVKWMAKGFPVKGRRHHDAAMAATTSCCSGASEATSPCCPPGTDCTVGSCCGTEGSPASAGCCGAVEAPTSSSCCG